MSEDTERLKPGDVLDHRYEVVRPLADGGMAAIYVVRHLGLQSLHALKVPDPRLFHNAEARHRFTTEGRIQALLRHPNIAQVTDIVVSPVPGLVMEYVEGGTLDELRELLPDKRLELPLVRELFLPVLEAMQEAHGHQVVHRDLTPRNILVMKGPRGQVHPKVTDFGIAKLLQEDPDAKFRTRTGMLLGTRPYMSPEQIVGTQEVDARTDIFALGAILYEALTGQLPFDAPSDFELMKRITEGTYAPPEQLRPGLPEPVCACVRKALAVQPSERFQDCDAFREALARALEESSALAAPPPDARVEKKTPRASASLVRRGLVMLLCLVPLGLAGVALTLFASNRRTLTQAQQEATGLRVSEQRARQEQQRLQAELNAARSQVLRAEVTARNLQTGHQEVLERLQRSEQRTLELQSAQERALKLVENTLTDTAVRNNLQGYRAVRTCNKTAESLTYQYQDETKGWSEPMLLAPQQCTAHWLTGYRARVPVRFGTAQSGLVQGEALAGLVLGRPPELDFDWKPWDNQLVPSASQGVELQSIYVEGGLLGGALPGP